MENDEIATANSAQTPDDEPSPNNQESLNELQPAPAKTPDISATENNEANNDESKPAQTPPKAPIDSAPIEEKAQKSQKQPAKEPSKPIEPLPATKAPEPTPSLPPQPKRQPAPNKPEEKQDAQELSPAKQPRPPLATTPKQTAKQPLFDIAKLDITQLSDAQLKAAAALWAKKNQKSISRKGVEKRQAVARENTSAILNYIATHSPGSNRTIARALNLPPRRVQHYMQLLTKQGKVTATGWASSRRYFKK